MLILRKKDEIISNLQKEVEEVVHQKKIAESALSSSVPAPEELIAKNQKLQELLDREIVEHLNTKLNLQTAEDKIDKLIKSQIESERVNKIAADNHLIQQRELLSQKEMVIDQAEQIQVNAKLIVIKCFLFVSVNYGYIRLPSTGFLWSYSILFYFMMSSYLLCHEQLMIAMFAIPRSYH